MLMLVSFNRIIMYNDDAHLYPCAMCVIVYWTSQISDANIMRNIDRKYFLPLTLDSQDDIFVMYLYLEGLF